jgi:UDP:flavonoid glycosyltransferase YjiC (YdhE family)
MRILFVSAPLIGHLYPMMPLALALRDAGHDVTVVAGGDALKRLPDGLPAVDAAPGFDFVRTARAVMVRHPLIGWQEIKGTAGTRGVSLLFAVVNEALGPGVRRAVRAVRPDLVVHEPLAVAGALAAAEAGVPAVLHGTILFDGTELTRVTLAAMRKTAPASAVTLTVAPPSVVGPRPGRPMRAVPYSGEGALPDWLAERGDRPRILVTRSTIAAPGGDAHMRRVVDAARGLDAEVVLVRPDDKLGADLPPTVRTTAWVPVSAALPHCAGIVHHGGSGTTLAALAAGVPQIVVPGAGDRRHNATLVADSGAGLCVERRALTRGALERLVTDARLEQRARAVGAEMAAMPGPEEVAAELPTLTSS